LSDSDERPSAQWLQTDLRECFDLTQCSSRTLCDDGNRCN
jgi:hypothetical protein